MNSPVADRVLLHSPSVANEVAVPESLRIAGYRLIKLIGRGGQGHVFQAIHLGDHRKVAIKVILPGCLADPRSRARFEQEWRTLKQLSHPNIVRVFDHGSLESGELWYAAQYIDGVPVNQFVHDLDRIALESSSGYNRFPIEQVLALFVRVCRGVEAAHQAGVLHRDLKPANILVDTAGEPHILDFGIARTMQPGSPDAVTLTGQFMGSPIWCSPEQIAARPSLIDARTDVYAIGMMLYHALTGDFPFDSELPWPQLFEVIRTAEPKAPGSIRSFIDADLETIVLTAITKEKERRYASVAALREDIERYLAGLPISARADSRVYRLRKFVRRNRLLVGSVAVVTVLTVVYSVSVTVLFRRAEQHAANARAKFRTARDVLDFTLSQVDAELAKLPGAANTRRVLLEKAFTQLDALLSEKTEDPELQADIAKTHSRLADIAQSLGRWDRAAEEVAAALEIRSQLAAQQPDDPTAQSGLSIALVRVGDIECGRGNRRAGHVKYRQALAIDESLVSAFPDNLHYLDNLSWSYDRLCWAALMDGDDPAATGFFEKRLALAHRLLDAAPTSPAFKRNLLCAYVQGSSVNGLPDAGPHGATIRSRFDAARRLALELLALEPENLEYLRGLVVANRSMANLVADEGHLEEAQQLLLEGNAIVERVVRAEPPNREWNLFRAVNLRELACLASRASDRRTAESFFRESIDRATAHLAGMPDDLDVQDLLGDSQWDLAQLLYETNRSDEAEKLFQQVIAFRKLVVARPSVEPRDFLKLADLLLVCPLDGLRDPEASLKLARLGVERTNRRSVLLLQVYSSALNANGRPEEARSTANEALSLLPPGHSRIRRSLSAALAEPLQP